MAIHQCSPGHLLGALDRAGIPTGDGAATARTVLAQPLLPVDWSGHAAQLRTDLERDLAAGQLDAAQLTDRPAQLHAADTGVPAGVLAQLDGRRDHQAAAALRRDGGHIAARIAARAAELRDEAQLRIARLLDAGIGPRDAHPDLKAAAAGPEALADWARLRQIKRDMAELEDLRGVLETGQILAPGQVEPVRLDLTAARPTGSGVHLGDRGRRLVGIG